MGLPDTDVAVIGAGPGGVAAALALLAEGLGVTLLDAVLAPAPRIESLPPHGIALANSLGLAPALCRASLGRAAAMRLYWRDRPETKDFGAEGPLLLDRGLFHAALRDLLPRNVIRAARVTGLQTEGDRVLLRLGGQSLSARFVIDARGRAGLRAPGRAGTSLVALCFSGLCEGPADQPGMLLQSLAEGWLWACHLPGGRLSGAVFLPASEIAGHNARSRAGRLGQHLAASALGVPAGLAAGPVVAAMLRAAGDPFASPLVLRIGDAALARDPIASHGLVHALRSAAQAAAATITLLDPAGDACAARAFMRDRHRDAARAARDGTARSHAEQTRHRTPFWTTAAADAAADAAAKPPEPARWPALSRPLALGPLRRAPVLEAGRIRWTEAIWLSRSGQAASRFGPVAAARLAGLLAPPAPIATLSARLEQVLEPALAQGILRQLLDEGALCDAAAGPAPGQALADDPSKA